MTDTPLFALSAAALAAGYRAGTFSPVDVLEAVLARREAVDPAINAVVALDGEGARCAAEASAARWRGGAPASPLDGVPVSIKDNLFLAGLPARWGSRLYEDFVPETDEPPVARLRAAGAVLFGKTNVPEFTLEGYTRNALLGTTFNPIAPGRTPGGSTGGGAAAVAAGIGPIAIGTDGGGSLRRPAAHCGLFALKPSIGQVARDGGFPALLSDFEVVGPVGRTLDDVARAFAVLRGPDACDPRTLATLAEPPDRPMPLRIAHLPTIGDAPVDAPIRAAVETAIEGLRAAGHTVVAVAPPFDAEAAAAAWGTVAGIGLAAHLGAIPGALDRVGPNARAIAEAGARRGAGEHVAALAHAAALRAAFGRFFTDYDLLVTPTTAALAWPAETAYPAEIDGRPVGPRGHAVFTGWVNIAGLPALSVPIGTTAEAGGIGLQLVAPHGMDLWLLRVAAGLLDPRQQKGTTA